MCSPIVDKLNKISKRIICGANLAPFSSPFVLPKDIRLAKSAAIYDAWIRNLEKRIDPFVQLQENISDLAAALNNRAKYNPKTRRPVAFIRDHTGTAKLCGLSIKTNVLGSTVIPRLLAMKRRFSLETRGILERYQCNPEGKWDPINLGNPFGSYLQASYIKELPSLPSKPLDTVRRTARDIYIRK